MASDDVRRLFGRKRTIEVLQLLSDQGRLNYSEIETSIESSSDTISQSLALLGEYSLVERHERSSRDVQYKITQKGTDLLEALERIESVLAQDA
ncbi:winged helix-turn-helix transcriptional regulator [Halomicroarcula sp. GCM10025709]|uniref:winged helix-turn-helix transcriptional regulator n=1 Tax=Haloarcula TaxID=2237 RepID=UPI00360667CA